MTREEHLEFCTQCLNRKFDSGKGIICGLTGQIASFEKECVDYKIDNSVIITVDDQTALNAKEIQEKLPTEILNQLRLQQNLTKAIVAGVVTAILCSILWAAITVYTTYQFTAMALLLAAAVGFAMRNTGKGIDIGFGLAGAIISLLGCILGNFLSIIGFLSHENDLGYIDTLFRFDFSYFDDVMIETFNVQHILFYISAIAVGFALSRKTLTSRDIIELKENKNIQP